MFEFSCPRSHEGSGMYVMDDSAEKRDRVLREALEYRGELMAYARSLLGNYSLAEDVVQESMIVAVKKFEQYQDGTSMLAWCRSIVRLEVLRMKRREKRERSLAERLLDDAIDAAFDEFQTTRRRDQSESWQMVLAQCLGLTTERGRSVLRARFVEELSYSQISESVGMTLEAVRKTLFRLKKQLRSCVETNMRREQ